MIRKPAGRPKGSTNKTKEVVVESYTNTKYDKLTDRQKRVFDLYTKYRTLTKVSNELNMSSGDLSRVYKSDAFQLALKEFNSLLSDKINYDAAVIVDKLWEQYCDDSTPPAVRVQILVHLGKHIGMWANSTGNKDSTPSVQYNIVNYNTIESEINANRLEVEKELVKVDTIEDADIPDGIQILSYK